ncbi:unnamed protein product [Callosobruchus maculatus]|uniref:MADF domain-containing protein n=2 Tax=Callosobruchus maculatus TaxID=64391 RepID=A0A653D4F9_CALMS|nr:unnamed protein product [Callosobruchus maculatus]VEN49358.1 unnamed protein product [Callosobruchus maculatus]VEN49449.1 unnamed protein product [Callosobruchus maculatus]VEN50890.1 unnamed protein product [Callosobruchus maculatus]VEN51216.1 unnamed protein product [Callosobruchus maculatus]
MSWSNEQTSLLIELYETYKCLYAIKHPDYHNKHKRSAAIKAIVEALKVGRPTATEQDVQKKFLGLRTTYAHERRKVLDSLRSGMGEDEVYRPTLWYYDKMSFLNDHLQIRSSRSSHPITEFAVTEEEALVVQAPPSEETTMYYEIGEDGVLSPASERPESGLSVHSNLTHPESTHSGEIPSTSAAKKRQASDSNATPKRFKNKSDTSEIEALQKVSDNLSNLSAALQSSSKNVEQPTADDIMGQFVASQFKKIKNEDIKQDVYFEIHKLLRDAIKKDTTYI